MNLKNALIKNGLKSTPLPKVKEKEQFKEYRAAHNRGEKILAARSRASNKQLVTSA
jgi:hypothetical protein